MGTVSFKYSPGQRVQTRFGSRGFITSCKFGEGGTHYYWVETKEDEGSWEIESSLTSFTTQKIAPPESDRRS
jgi:hypothetical protein